MSHNTNSRVNPFFIQDHDDEEDPWEDEDDDDEYGGGGGDDDDNTSDEDYYHDDEQRMLMSRSGSHHNRNYSVSHGLPQQSLLRRHNPSHLHLFDPGNNRSRSYHNHNNNPYDRYDARDPLFHHSPKLWKYGILMTAFGAMLWGGFLSVSSSSPGGGSANSHDQYVSLIDEIPNDEYRIVVLGERHSGTDWMRDRLAECFPHADVSTELQRPGYLFQDDEASADAKAAGSVASSPRPRRDTIIVHVTLNAYDWLERMRISPEYAPAHVHVQSQETLDNGHWVALDWKDFLNRPWTTERPPRDEALANATGPVCQMGFAYDEVVPCAEKKHGSRTTTGDALYEHRPLSSSSESDKTNGKSESATQRGGLPFDSVIDLRAAKLNNHHGVLDHWPSVRRRITVRYETLAETFRSEVLAGILDETGWYATAFDHDGDGNGDGTADVLPCGIGKVFPHPLDTAAHMTAEFVEYVTDRVDWETEDAVAGYQPWTDADLGKRGIPTSSSSLTSTQASNNGNNSTDGKPSDDGAKSAQNKDPESSDGDAEPKPTETTETDSSGTTSGGSETEQGKSARTKNETNGSNDDKDAIEKTSKSSETTKNESSEEEHTDENEEKPSSVDDEKSNNSNDKKQKKSSRAKSDSSNSETENGTEDPPSADSSDRSDHNHKTNGNDEKKSSNNRSGEKKKKKKKKRSSKNGDDETKSSSDGDGESEKDGNSTEKSSAGDDNDDQKKERNDAKDSSGNNDETKKDETSNDNEDENNDKEEDDDDSEHNSDDGNDTNRSSTKDDNTNKDGDGTKKSSGGDDDKKTTSNSSSDEPTKDQTDDSNSDP